MRSLLIQLLPKLRRFAFSLTGNVADADDLVQGTVERLLTNEQTRYQPSAALVFTVCKNIWIDEVRKRRVRHTDEFIESNHTATHAESSQEDLIEIKELMKAVNQLPDNSREILSMVAIAGLSYAEAADELDIPVGTVMSRISRARIALADIMQRAEITESGGNHALH